MARRHGSRGRLYVAIASGGTAEAIAFLNKWSLDFSVDAVDVTAFGDTNKVYVSGLPDSSGDFAGFFDDATAQLYTAATDGVARKFYLYPDLSNASGVYYFGTALFDFHVEGSTDAAVTVSGNLKAASSIIKVG